MPRFEITVSERKQEWSKDNEPLQSGGCFAGVQCETPDTPGFGKSSALQSVGTIDTPGYGSDGPLSPLSD